MEDAHPPHKPPGHSATIDLRGIQFDVLEERQVVEKVVRNLGSDSPGWIVTANIDIMRICSVDQVAAALVQQATCVVADGMPVLWAARIAGTPLPERVTGSSLIFSVSAALAKQGARFFSSAENPVFQIERPRTSCAGSKGCEVSVLTRLRSDLNVIRQQS
ncbi:MAG: WecB/TagA/CpsF family glycosyltransferase [Nocardioidaceae bacterium]